MKKYFIILFLFVFLWVALLSAIAFAQTRDFEAGAPETMYVQAEVADFQWIEDGNCFTNHGQADCGDLDYFEEPFDPCDLVTSEDLPECITDPQ